MTQRKDKVVLSENALQVAKTRYFNNGEDWEQCTYRVGKAVAEVEREKTDFANKFHEMIYNMDFIPGGRILRNAGRPKGSMLNCYVCPIQDSIEDIGQFIKDALTLWSEGGGVGCNFSPLRPMGADILGKGGKSSGLVSFIEAADSVSRTIESGGQRRAAALACVDVSHPEVMDFINAKLKDGRLSHFNISVIVNEDFLKVVEADGDWTFKFNQIEYKTVRARDIWELIVSNMVKMAEPGLLNGTNLYKNNSYYFDPVVSTNPCHTGDTLIAVADGRKLVTFEQLANEGMDVPVFSMNEETKRIEVKMMRNPRKTGVKQRILKVYLDNGTSFKANDVHKITMFNGEEKQLKDLVIGDRIHHMIRYQSNLSTILETENKQNYIWMTNGYQSVKAEHRLVGEYIIGRPLEDDEVVHHIDYNYQNNSPENLQVMKKVDHDELHKKDKIGIKNPIHRFPDKNYFKNHKFLGSENGNYKGFSKEQMMEIAINFSKDLGRKSSISEWENYCKKNNYTYDSRLIFGEFGYKGGFLEEAARRAEVVNFDGYHTRQYNEYLKIVKTTDLDVFFDNGIKVRKYCKRCNKEMILSWGAREQSYCSIKCRNERPKPELKEASFNFKVIKIEEVGYEDVYNGTVDDNHNYYVFTGDDLGKNNKPRMNFINSKNCGEAVLENYGSCCLGSLVLPNFITGTTNTNWQKLEKTIKLAIRFLDNVIDVNKYTLKEIDLKGHNSRRIGLGVMGLADYLFAKELRYGSKDALSEIERLMRFIRDTAYQTSVEIAMEKGSFPKFDPVYYGNASFVRKLPASLRMDIKSKGIRNVTLLSIAPTGTISLLRECSSGIEPLIFKSYKRNDRVGERIYIHPKYKQLLLTGNSIPEWFVDMTDITPKDHFETQAIIQKYVDGAVSKTINMPVGTTDEDLSTLLLEYVHELKGCTVYIDGSREGQVYNNLSEVEALEYILNESVSNELSVDDVECNCQKPIDENGKELEGCVIPKKD